MAVPVPIQYIHNETGEVFDVTLITFTMMNAGNEFWDMDLAIGDYLLEHQDGRVPRIIKEAELKRDYTVKLHFRSPADAQSLRAEYAYLLAHHEDELSETDLNTIRHELRQVRIYLSGAEEL
jgi:hypothetical protein